MKQFTALYTKHVTQKNKRWIDGFVRINMNNKKITLLDENKIELGSHFLKGSEIDFDNPSGAEIKWNDYLIQIDEEIENTKDSSNSPRLIKQKSHENLNPYGPYNLHSPSFKQRNKYKSVRSNSRNIEKSKAIEQKANVFKPFKAPSKVNVPKGGRDESDMLSLLTGSVSKSSTDQTLKKIPKKLIPQEEKTINHSLDESKDPFNIDEQWEDSDFDEEINDFMNAFKEDYESKQNTTKESKETKEPKKPKESNSKKLKNKLFDESDDDLLDVSLEKIIAKNQKKDIEIELPQVDSMDELKKLHTELPNDETIQHLNENVEELDESKKKKLPPMKKRLPKIIFDDTQDDELLNDIKFEDILMKKPKKKIQIIDDEPQSPPHTSINSNAVSPAPKAVYHKSTPPRKSNKPIIPVGPPNKNGSTKKFNIPKFEEKNSILDIVKKYMGTKNTLFFPDEKTCYDFANKRPSRSVNVPDSFKTVFEYKTIYMDAVYEQMNLELFDLSLKFRELYARISNEKSTNAPSCKHGKAKLLTVKKPGPNQGRMFYSCPKGQKGGCNLFVWADSIKNTSGYIKESSGVNITDPKAREEFFRKEGIPFYHKCELIKSTGGSGRKQIKKTQWFLKIENKERGSVYAKDDIWIVSTNPSFGKDANIVIFKSVYHGPTTTGLLEVELVAGSVRSQVPHQEVSSIRGPNFSTQLEIINNLDNLDPVRLPLLYELLGNSEKKTTKTSCRQNDSFNLGYSADDIKKMVDNFIEKYHLNEDQQQVLKNCSQWFLGDEKFPNISLVHGVFGAGKSYLLVVLILFFCTILDSVGNKDIRILISAVTNVAVDKILQELLDFGFKDFIRVGSRRKIAKTILPYTVADDKSKKEIIREYKQMLKEPMEQSEAEGLKQAIEELESGVSEQRREALQQVRVVGVTCAASTFDVLKESKFSILILDESSQCLEPLALLPLSKFSCQKLIAVGDPLQLPPTLTGSTGDESIDSIGKTLFIRLANVGFQPLLLSTQYRCHPQISRLSNIMFYENRLKDGISEKDRSALIVGLPPVVFIDVPNGKESFVGSGSLYNEEEIKVVIQLVRMLMDEKIPPNQIGIIALYRTQAFKIYTELKMKSVKVSTVDAFQGGEREIIILSCCRTGNFGLGFIENEQRINVAITRAKRHLIIVGNKKALYKSKLWKFVIDQANLNQNGIIPASLLLLNKNFHFLEPLQEDILDEELRIADEIMEEEMSIKRKRIIEDDEESPSKKLKIVDDDDVEPQK